MEGLNRDLGKIIYMLKKSSNTHVEIRPGERRLNREEGGREAMAALRGKSGLAEGIATEETGGNLCVCPEVLQEKRQQACSPLG